MSFEFATATRIIFGDGAIAQLPDLVAPLGKRALLVTGAAESRAQAAAAIATLDARGIDVSIFGTKGEPSIETAEEGIARAQDADCDLVVGFGGGSAIDSGKAIAALVANGGAPLDYLEVIGAGKQLTEPSLPFVAVPTTAGTGAEVTRNAVLASKPHRVKVSLRSPLMLPTIALVDPELTHSMPPTVTASTGLDALTQVIEPLISHAANPLTDGICREGIRRAARSLRRAFDHGGDADARRDVALTSLFGGLALANAKLGAVHGFAGPVGGMFDAPHGVICARFLPLVMETNLRALRSRAADHPAIPRFDEIARLLTGADDARAEDGIRWLTDLCDHLAVPGLGELGMTPEDLGEVAEKSSKSSSMKGNPIELTRDELESIARRAL